MSTVQSQSHQCPPVSPEMVSLTVQVRVRPAVPASNGAFCDICVSTLSEPAGTAEIGTNVVLHNHIHCMYVYLPLVSQLPQCMLYLQR